MDVTGGRPGVRLLPGVRDPGAAHRRAALPALRATRGGRGRAGLPAGGGGGLLGLAAVRAPGAHLESGVT